MPFLTKAPILVTGGAGFIGANFVLDWIEEVKTSVIILDKLTYAGNIENLASLKNNPLCEFIEGDIGDAAVLDRIFTLHHPRAVVNFAAETHIDRTIDNPVSAELPAFAEALSPEEWISYYDIPVPNGKVDADAAGRAFARQLGPAWRGTMHMAPYKQILLAAFCLKSVRKRADADDMLGQLSKSWSFEGGLKLDGSLISKARKILRDRDISGKILTKCNQHAYENTVMIRALATAREEGGVLAPAQFLWLRAFDRLLWYPLNNLGRQSHHMEALGAMCHYKAEKMAQRPIPRPKTEDAVKSISEYIASPNARPIPALDYSKSSKRAIKKVKS